MQHIFEMVHEHKSIRGLQSAHEYSSGVHYKRSLVKKSTLDLERALDILLLNKHQDKHKNCERSRAVCIDPASQNLSHAHGLAAVSIK